MRKGPAIASFAIIYLFDSPEMINILRHPRLVANIISMPLGCIQEPICSEEGVLVLLSSRHVVQTGSIIRSVEVGCFYRIVLFSPSKSFSPVTHARGDGQPHTCGYHHSRIFWLLIQELQGWVLGLLSRGHIDYSDGLHHVISQSWCFYRTVLFSL